MGLFTKKAGGTLFGNLLRGVSNKLTGGILGNGANRIEIGQTKTNAQLAKEAQSLQDQINQSQATINAGFSLGGGLQDVLGSQNTANYTNTLPVVGQLGNSGTFNLLFLVGIGLAIWKFFFSKKR